MAAARTRMGAWSEQLAQTARARALLALCAALIGAGVIAAEYFDCDCLLLHNDDSYITYRYARNLATGHGLVFNTTEATDAASSFLYTLLLALCHRLGFTNLPLVACAIGVTCAAACAAIVCLACVQRTQRGLLGLFLGCALPLNGMISAWAVNGMETLFFTLLVTLSVYRLFFCGAFGWLEAVLVLAVALTRYEGWLLAGLWFGLGVLRWRRSDARARRELVSQLALVSAAVAGFALFKLHTYGSVLPDSFRLKRLTVLYAPRPSALWEVWWSSASALVALGAIGLALLPRTWLSAALAAYVLLSAASLILGPFSDWARYSVHLLPLTIMLAAVPMARLLRRAPWLAAPLGLMIAGQGSYAFVKMQPSFEMAASEAACRLQIGAYLNSHLPAHSVVLSSDIGAIAYAAPELDFVDAVGLTSKDVLRERARGRSADAVLFARRPSVIADSCYASCAEPPRFSAYYWLTDPNKWRTPLPKLHYLSGNERGEVLARCRSADGLSIAAARFGFAADGGAR